ncbi:hypothetical protein OG895_43305 [Streptomyces sp. NBC_00201]|uniref:hypothetical protein n=1 Tax=unclassified Streptomyces TaxID=2593676 RepID=UPI00225484B0|nr:MULTISPECIES: hypothetical protein [unclassified Streptomyces]MCX5063724.1 hypothetical protein [Streptomyces sp. NBC_00452]MCX5251879.1 hypothetical protein [Streptomyces sp. NBC_00201]MCX5294218.1 hypothetical protein [Streptomyces sp. NBC_00183]
MSSPKVQATAIVSMLTTALGAAPSQDESDERFRVEAEVPVSLGESARLDLLDFLFNTADRFGHSVRKDGTSVIWAEVDRQGEL